MKPEREIETFKKLMVTFGFEDIDVKSAPPNEYDVEGAYMVGFNNQLGFSMDVDIVPCEIEVTLTNPKRNVLLDPADDKTEKVQGFVITGYKPTPYRYDEPPDVEDFIIGTETTLQRALTAVVNYYVQGVISNAWASANMDEMSEGDDLTY